MAEYPALPLFTDAYLADTRHLSTIQHGAYLLLLMTAWRSQDCALPNDDTYLARVAGMDRRTWANNKTVIMAFWSLNADGKYVQARLVDERDFVRQVSIRNSAAGRASALKRKNRDSTSVQPDANENATPTPTPTPTPTVATDRTSPSTTEGGGAFQRIFEVGTALFPNLVTQSTAAIHSWITAGCDIELDILPTLRRMAGQKPRSWSYFSHSIADAKVTREQPLPTGAPRGDIHGTTAYANRPQKSKFELAVEATERARATRERGRTDPA